MVRQLRLAAAAFLLLLPLSAACGQAGGESASPADSLAVPSSTPAPRTDCASRYATLPAQREYWPTGEWRQSSLEQHCLDRSMVEEAASIFENNHATTSLLIVRHGELVYERYFFPFNTPERRVPIFSITKSVLSALVGIALDQGRLDSLDRRVVEYFPEYFTPQTDARMRQVSLRHLLSMSSGFLWLEDSDIEQDWVASGNMVEAAINLQFMEAPGSGFNYSSANTQLLAAVLTETVDASLREYAQENLFTPLGIQPQEWNWGTDNQGYYLGGWGMNLTPRDLARFGYLYLNEGYWDGTQLVSQDWVRQSTSAQINVDRWTDYGYLWWVHDRTEPHAFEAIGYGGQSITIVPELDLVVVVTGAVSGDNRSGAPDPSSTITQYIIRAVTDE